MRRYEVTESLPKNIASLLAVEACGSVKLSKKENRLRATDNKSAIQSARVKLSKKKTVCAAAWPLRAEYNGDSIINRNE